MLVLKLIVFVLVHLLSVTRINCQQAIGDRCTVNHTQSTGECKLLRDCQSAIDDIRYRAIRSTPCGIGTTEIIVCCSDTETSSVQGVSASNLTDTKRVEKCREYGEHVYDKSRLSSVLKVDRCGIQAVPLIVGGERFVNTRELPHSALLGYYDAVQDEVVPKCGGSLVSSRYVLTAAHCTHSREFGALNIVRLGDLNIDSDEDNAQPINVTVEKIIRHPEFHSTQRYNDIALVKLAEKISLSPYIRPICLPTNSEIPMFMYASGWGSTNPLGTNETILYKERMDEYKNDKCNEFYTTSNHSRAFRNGIIDSQMCAISRKGDCLEENGGPLQIYAPDVYCSYIQLGIASFDNGCRNNMIPLVYTKVYEYADWIEGIIWAPGEDE